MTDGRCPEERSVGLHRFECSRPSNGWSSAACFTGRQNERITPEAVAEGKQAAANQTLAELVASVELGEYEGQETAKVKMASGRTLTTLIKTNGVWLADTVWFK